MYFSTRVCNLNNVIKNDKIFRQKSNNSNYDLVHIYNNPYSKL